MLSPRIRHNVPVGKAQAGEKHLLIAGSGDVTIFSEGRMQVKEKSHIFLDNEARDMPQSLLQAGPRKEPLIP